MSPSGQNSLTEEATFHLGQRKLSIGTELYSAMECLRTLGSLSLFDAQAMSLAGKHENRRRQYHSTNRWNQQDNLHSESSHCRCSKRVGRLLCRWLLQTLSGIHSAQRCWRNLPLPITLGCVSELQQK